MVTLRVLQQLPNSYGETEFICNQTELFHIGIRIDGKKRTSRKLLMPLCFWPTVFFAERSHLNLSRSLRKWKPVYSWSSAEQVGYSRRLTCWNNSVEQVREYINLSQLISMKGDIKLEIYCRLESAEKGYGRKFPFFRSNMPIHLREIRFDQCVLPVLDIDKQKLTTAQRIRINAWLDKTRQ